MRTNFGEILTLKQLKDFEKEIDEAYSKGKEETKKWIKGLIKKCSHEVSGVKVLDYYELNEQISGEKANEIQRE